MAKTPLEKQMDKARKEASVAAQQEAVRQRAATIVNAQRTIDGLRCIDETAEPVLKRLIENCKNHESGYVSYSLDDFPKSIAHSIDFEIEKLIQYGMITPYKRLANGGILYLLPCAFSYFEKKASIQEQNKTDEEKVSPIIFISHRSTDQPIAEMVREFLVLTGIPSESIFCSSLPGNDVHEKIPQEVRMALKNSAINIAILSKDYYESAYCLNEAGVAWYRDDITTIPIALPEIDVDNMLGFLDKEYKFRRLDCDTDISNIYDQVRVAVSVAQTNAEIITNETQKLKKRYAEFLENKKKQAG